MLKFYKLEIISLLSIIMVFFRIPTFLVAIHASSHREAARTTLAWIEIVEEPPEGSNQLRRTVIYRGGRHAPKRKDSLYCRLTIFTSNGSYFWTSRELLSKLATRSFGFITENFCMNTRENGTLNAIPDQIEPNLEVTICMQGHLGLQIRDWGPFRTCFDFTKSIGGLRISKWATIEKLIFRSKPPCTVERAILVYMLLGLYFGIRAYS